MRVPRSPSVRELVDAVDVDVRAEGGERVHVRVETPAADDVAARRRHGDAAEAREQRAGEEERRADLPRELGVEVGLLHAARVDANLVRARSTRRRHRGRRAARPSSRRRGCAGRSRDAPPPRRARTPRGSGARRSCCPTARTVPAQRPTALDDEGLHRAGNATRGLHGAPLRGQAGGCSISSFGTSTGRLEAEDLCVERELGLERADDVLRLAEAVALRLRRGGTRAEPRARAARRR